MHAERQRLRMLVAVKAYPQVGQRTGESVCVAGIRAEAPHAWVRLFPVPFRDMDPGGRFRKYQLVEVDVERPRNDRRPESWRPDVDSLQVGRVLDNRKGWALRWPYVEPVLIDSMCELQERQRVDGASLGAFRPADVDDVKVTPATPWSAGKVAVTQQTSFGIEAPGRLGLRQHSPLEQIPWVFQYVYRCAAPTCRGHRQSIIDWELGQAWRSWAGSEQERNEAVRQKWLEVICAPERDTIFFVGNLHQHPTTFLVLGTFWPPKGSQPDPQLPFG